MDEMLPWIWLTILFGGATFWVGKLFGEHRGLKRGTELGHASGYVEALRKQASIFGRALQSRQLTVPELADLAGPAVTAEAVRAVISDERATRELWAMASSRPAPPTRWLARDPDAEPRVAPGGLLEICRELLEGHIDGEVFRVELSRRGLKPTAFWGGPGSGLAACLGWPGNSAVGDRVPGDEPSIGTICNEFMGGGDQAGAASRPGQDPAAFVARLVERIGELGVETHVAHRLGQLADPAILARVWRGPGDAPHIW